MLCSNIGEVEISSLHDDHLVTNVAFEETQLSDHYLVEIMLSVNPFKPSKMFQSLMKTVIILYILANFYFFKT